MKWEDRPESDNVEVVQGTAEADEGPANQQYARNASPGGGFPLPFNLGGFGIGTIIIILIGAYLIGLDPIALLSGRIEFRHPSQVAQQQQRVPTPAPPPNRTSDSASTSTQDLEKLTRFVSVILKDTEIRWEQQLPAQAGTLVPDRAGQQYIQPKMVVSKGEYQTPCGAQSKQTGPFYCPTDQKVYIDLKFFDVLKNRFHTEGDFANAYVIAHEVGHHIQQILGILPKFNQARRNMSEVQANKESVKVELQADCFAGVWAHFAKQDKDFIADSEIPQALNAATQIGDDAIQKSVRGYANAETFTHGSSEQRVRWFKTGFERGQLSACDTFNAPRL